MTRVAVTGLCASCLLLAVDAPRHKVQQTKTERMEFPLGGLLRLSHSMGEVTIDAWDEPGLEITTTKTTEAAYDSATRQKGVEELDQVRMAAERHGDERVLTTTFPPHSHFKPQLPGSAKVDLESHMYVPRAARLAIENGSGNVYVEDVTGNIEASVGQGTILLRLPEEGHYEIDARSKWGSVTSDFAGQARKSRWLVGHQFAGHEEAGAKKLYLRAGYGDIIILKERQPKGPETRRQ